MTNYTFEQRKMIAEYLEELICSCKANSTHLSICYLKEEVKKLKTITFGDIKNQVGVRFKTNDSNNIYIVVKDVITSGIVYFDTKNATIFSGEWLSDIYQVEVINETETD